MHLFSSLPLPVHTLFKSSFAMLSAFLKKRPLRQCILYADLMMYCIVCLLIAKSYIGKNNKE